jgi:hypothetical protein
MRCLLGLLLVSSVYSQDQETTPAAPPSQEPIAAPTPTNPIMSCAKTEILYEIEAEADVRFPLENMNTSLRVLNATNPTLSRFESEDVFPLFVQVRESGRYRYKKCLSKADCFLAQLDVWDPDLVTFKQDGKRIESRSTFPRWNSTRTYVELGNCLPTCEVSGKDYMILSAT